MPPMPLAPEDGKKQQPPALLQSSFCLAIRGLRSTAPAPKQGMSGDRACNRARAMATTSPTSRTHRHCKSAFRSVAGAGGPKCNHKDQPSLRKDPEMDNHETVVLLAPSPGHCEAAGPSGIVVTTDSHLVHKIQHNMPLQKVRRADSTDNAIATQPFLNST